MWLSTNHTFCRVSRSRCQQSLLIPDFELLLIQKLGKVGDHLVLVLGFGLYEVCQLLRQFGDGVFSISVAVRQACHLDVQGVGFGSCDAGPFE
jgi:hypothetical protein